MSLLLFDLDGTLVDSRKDLADSINAVRMSFGLEPLTQETIVGYIGDGIRILLGRSIPEIGKGANQDEALKRMSAIYGEHSLDNTRPYPGVKETLNELAARHTLILTSNKMTEPSIQILKGLDILEPFADVFGNCHKPDPTVIMEAMQKAGFPPQDTWMIGDNHTDLAAAEAANIRSCFCNFGFGSRKPGQRSDAVVSSFSQLQLFFK